MAFNCKKKNEMKTNWNKLQNCNIIFDLIIFIKTKVKTEKWNEIGIIKMIFFLFAKALTFGKNENWFCTEVVEMNQWNEKWILRIG